MSGARVRVATADDLPDWSAMRAALWPDDDVATHRATIVADLPDAIMAEVEGRAVGFAEAALRHDYVNGCDTSPVVFLEGIYVRPEARRRGVARALCAAVAAWGRARGAREIASDAPIDNLDSHRVHAALGFGEAERVVFFRRRLDDRPDREDRPA